MKNFSFKNNNVDDILDYFLALFDSEIKKSKRILFGFDNYKDLDLGVAIILNGGRYEILDITKRLEEWGDRIRPKANLIEEISVKKEDDYIVAQVKLKQNKNKKKKKKRRRDKRNKIWEQLPYLFEKYNGDVEKIAKEVDRSVARVKQKIREMNLRKK